MPSTHTTAAPDKGARPASARQLEALKKDARRNRQVFQAPATFREASERLTRIGIVFSDKTEEPKPTARQKKALSGLAASRGQTFQTPKTMAQASEQIQALMAAKPISSYERQRERDIATSVGRGRVSAANVGEDEVEGYGSTATWSKVA
jgi:hypothetical protein